MGVPCLAYEWRGVRDAIDDRKGGWLTEPGNVPGLAANLIDALLLSLSDYRCIAEYARKAMIRRFSEDIVIEQYRVAIRNE
jgi:glycosyltransferase involved in cell wall biosynthesis